jgi:hypothetical protein
VENTTPAAGQIAGWRRLGTVEAVLAVEVELEVEVDELEVVVALVCPESSPQPEAASTAAPTRAAETDRTRYGRERSMCGS